MFICSWNMLRWYIIEPLKCVNDIQCKLKFIFQVLIAIKKMCIKLNFITNLCKIICIKREQGISQLSPFPTDPCQTGSSVWHFEMLKYVATPDQNETYRESARLISHKETMQYLFKGPYVVYYKTNLLSISN